MREKHTLVIDAHDKPELVERILRVVRHRGFTLRTLDMHHRQDGQNNVQIRLTVESTRSIDTLYHQLDKLWDITQVRSASQQAESLD